MNTTYSGGDQSEDAAITNLFYWMNIIHDVTYQYGFDEASGNFQQNNYGNAGLGNDPINAEAQDGSGTCNANYSHSADGNRPRIQMYTCGNRDGDLDNLVIIHEYAHGISLRLNSLGGQEQMGEGWSDYYGLMLTMKSGDVGTDSRGIGTWLNGNGPGGPGFRAYPYSTNFGVNPHTYDAIKTAVAPHGVGSVWAEMLWEMTWELIALHGFDSDIYNGTGGNNVALALVTEGLKLQPPNAGFVDGRDAILLADQAMYGGANQCVIWDAFARRGLGFSAVQGSSASKTDGTEAFDVPPSFSSFDTVEEVCLSDGIQTGLSGGNPAGGVYSGPGVTDNGGTFTFDPSIGGQGLVTVTYMVNDFCTGVPTTLTDDINVTNDPPEIVCMGTENVPMTGSSNSNPGTTINDNTTITSTLTVTDNVSITDLDVLLNINHTWVSDLVITLESPAGTVITIFDPSTCSGNDVVILLDDEAPSTSSVCYGGGTNQAYPDPSYQPFSPLSAFDGENTMGDWILSVSDNESLDTGTLNSWGIEYDYEVDAPTLDVTLDASGNATVNAEDLIFSAVVECGGYTVLAGSPLAETVSFSCSDIGLKTIDVEVTNDNGAIATCSAIVNVIGNGTPEPFVCPADTTHDNDPGICGAVVTYSIDPPLYCSGGTLTQTAGLASGSIFPVGTTTNTFEYDDGVNPIQTCSFDVTVTDIEDPIITCPANITQDSDPGVCEALVTFTPTATDNCTVASIVSVPASGSVFPVGITTVTVTATDTAGNTDVCTFDVTIEDNEAPVVSCPGAITQDSDPGVCEAVVSFTPTADDNCGIASVVSVPASGSVFPVGTTTVTVTATDTAGNTDVCTFDVTIEDNEAPVVSCPGAITQDSDPGVCEAIVTFTSTADDNCGVASVVSVPASGSVFSVGTTTVTITATDTAGNTDVCTFDVTVEDNEAPVVSCPGAITQDSDPGVCEAVVSFTPTADDNCGVASVVSVPASGSAFPVGTTTVTVTATDTAGNTDVCTFDVTIEDNELPNVVCIAPFSIVLDTNGEALITAAAIDDGSTDNCGIASLSVSPDSFTCADVGPNQVTLTAIDTDGNEATCTTTITIEKRAITVTYTGDLSEQYSDQVDLSAVLVDFEGNEVEGKTVSFTLGSQSTSAVIDFNGIAATTLILTQDPNATYTVETEIAEDPCNLESSDSDPFDILQENAILEYTGHTLQATPSSNSSEATVVLSANIQDITVTDFINDPFEGDIRNAFVKFVNRDSDSDISGWIPVTDLINPNDFTTGTVSYEWLVDIGNQTSESYTVGILVGTLDSNGYYLRNNADDNTVVTVYVPAGDFITGGGNITPDNSAGQYASTDGLKTNFGFNVKYNKNGRNLKGHMNVIFRRLENGVIHTYQIKGNAIQSLGVDIADPENKVAEFVTKSNLKDITDPLNPISLGGNLILQVDLTDRGEPGINDSMGITLSTSGGTLLYSSNWTGIVTDELLLSGGNLVVHSGFSNRSMLGDETYDLSLGSVMLYPNPATGHVLLSNPKNIPLKDVSIYDVTGRLIKKMDASDPTSEVRIDVSELASATYMVLIHTEFGQITKQLVKE